MKEGPTVFVIDDEAECRASVRRLITAAGIEVEDFGSADDFLRAYDPARPGCILLDLRLPDLTGLELQERIVAINPGAAIIFVTAFATIQAAVMGMQRGAVDFIEKPVRAEELLETIQRAIATDASKRETWARRKEAAIRLAALTSREREVMELLVAGLSVRQIGEKLGISPKTVQIHRAHILDKTRCSSLVALARLRLVADGELDEQLTSNGLQL